jgi:hypothetical protein
MFMKHRFYCSVFLAPAACLIRAKFTHTHTHTHLKQHRVFHLTLLQKAHSLKSEATWNNRCHLETVDMNARTEYDKVGLS